MNNNSALKRKTHRKTEQNSPNTMTQQRPATVKDRQTGRNKRKASPEQTPPKKRKKMRLNLDQDNEAASSSVDTNRVESSSKRSRKRKAADAGEGPNRKKMRSLDLRETQETAKQTTKQTIQHTTQWMTKQTTKQTTKRTTKQTTKWTTKQTTKRTTQHTTQHTTKQLAQQMTKQVNKLMTETTTQHTTKHAVQQRDHQIAQQANQSITKQKQAIQIMIKQMTKDVPNPRPKWMPKQNLTVLSPKAKFEAKYEEQNQLGAGGCGCVFAGYRKADNLPVAIKHVPKDSVPCKHKDSNGNQISIEVAIMEKLSAGTSGSVGSSASVSLLDWYDLDEELVLVMERPAPCIDLFHYAVDKGGSLQEEEAKIIMRQLVQAAIELEDEQIFHRDIKVENILIETGSDIPRVRLIDFGLGCFAERTSSLHTFYGTLAHIPPEWFSHFYYMAGPTTVWQMGVVLFDTLHRKSQFDTARFIRNKLKIKGGLSENCRSFLKACLGRRPEQRPTLEQLLHHPWLR